MSEGAGATFPAIGDYALLSDCHGAALVSRQGAVEWCCLPRFDNGSCFNRILDRERGGHCSIVPRDGLSGEPSRRYVGDTLALETTLPHAGGAVVVRDFLAATEDLIGSERRRLVRIVEARDADVAVDVRIAPRLDDADVRPWVGQEADDVACVIGGNDALVIATPGVALDRDEHDLHGTVELAAGDSFAISIQWASPVDVDDGDLADFAPTRKDLDELYEQTLAYWREWAERLDCAGPDEAAIRRSALTLKALTYAPTGAIIAAPTTSLPEWVGGGRNWDYRFSWVRDSSFSSRAFAELGCEEEAASFRRFILRSTAGHAQDLRILYGVGGERRIAEQEIELDGYRSSQPVRIGNGAAGQLQLDTFGELVNLTWRWHRRGHTPDEAQWSFVVSVVEEAIRHRDDPDAGIWESRGEPQHHVHSKVLCWAAIDRALQLAEDLGHDVPRERWEQARDELRETIERRGYDEERGIFVGTFDKPGLDAANLLLPVVGFVDWSDERMLRTTDAIREELGDGSGALVRRQPLDPDNPEGTFLACSFWLVECLAKQGRLEEAREVFSSVNATANDLGLFSEEWDPKTASALGNFPQGLTHLAQIDAAVALAEAQG